MGQKSKQIRSDPIYLYLSLSISIYHYLSLSIYHYPSLSITIYGSIQRIIYTILLNYNIYIYISILHGIYIYFIRTDMHSFYPMIIAASNMKHSCRRFYCLHSKSSLFWPPAALSVDVWGWPGWKKKYVLICALNPGSQTNSTMIYFVWVKFCWKPKKYLKMMAIIWCLLASLIHNDRDMHRHKRSQGYQQFR